MRTLIGVLLLLTIGVPASAEVLCPRVTSEHNADLSDLGRFRQYHKWKNKQDQELAIAIWQYLCGQQTGLFHMKTVNDGPDPWGEYSTVRDPVKLMNIHNVGYCGIFGPTLDGVFHGAGFERGRAFGVPGWNHCTTEVWYNGGWHYFDLDVRGALMKPDGTVASVAEAQANRHLWVNPQRKIEPFFPNDENKARVFEIYRDSRIDNYYRWFQAGHVMDFRLRQGETFTRWWRPQGGRWHHLDAYNTGFIRKLLEKDPVGYKSNHPDFSIWTQGNGLFRYEPNLTDASSDFRDGVRAAKNLEPGGEGLKFETTGNGEAVFEVFSPWIIVPKVGKLDDKTDDSEASIVTLDAARSVTVLVSLDQGKTWKQVATTQRGQTSVDLTKWVKGTYGFLLKLQAAGQANEPLLHGMTIETWVQVAPISLPRLKSGQNRCSFEIGDRYGKLTMPMFILPNVADPDDLKKYVVEMPKDYDLKRKSARIRGDVVLKLEAPKGTTIDWFTAGACFRTHQNQGAKNTDNRIAYAVDKPTNFTEIYKANVPVWVNHWRYQWDEDVQLDKPTEVVLVKYTGNPAVNVIRATVHLKPEKTPQRAINITHAYKIGDRLIERVVPMQQPGNYVINVEGEPENVFVRMAVPSKTD
ncbi:MAG: hypothetical protein QGG71_26145 [Pirellulaceae bacterium]|nr:hypothetical protein [Pirellulaceae bacterium]